jgi:CheY-like chemotaxis protein
LTNNVFIIAQSVERVSTIQLLKEGAALSESILNGKTILAVDDEPDVLSTLEEEILGAAPECKFEKATTYEEAASKLESQTYDLVILDIMGVRGLDLLELAVSKNLRVAMLTAHALTPETLERSFKMKARAYLPKEKLGEVVPFLEDVLKYEFLPGWKHLMKKLEKFFKTRWREYEQKKVRETIEMIKSGTYRYE